MRWELVDWRMDVCEQFFSDRLFVLSLDKERSLDIRKLQRKISVPTSYQHRLCSGTHNLFMTRCWEFKQHAVMEIEMKIAPVIGSFVTLVTNTFKCAMLRAKSLHNWILLKRNVWNLIKVFLGTWDCGDLNAADSREPRLVIIGLVAVYKFQSDKLSLLFLSQKDDEPVFQFF